MSLIFRNKMNLSKVELADRVIDQLGLLVYLQGNDAHIVSSIHAGLDIEGSDIDIICSYSSQSDYLTRLTSLPYLTESGKIDISEHNVVCSFWNSGFEFEIYASEELVVEQHGYKHFIVMQRLVAIGGADFQSKVRSLKRIGLKTEPAIANLLGLSGNPYESVLRIYDYSDADLRNILSKASYKSRAMPSQGLSS